VDNTPAAGDGDGVDGGDADDDGFDTGRSDVAGCVEAMGEMQKWHVQEQSRGQA